jgi:hypothetical protein
MVTGTEKPLFWHPSGALDERSRTELTWNAVEVVLAATCKLKPLVGAFESTLMSELAQAVGLLEVGVPQAMLVILIGYGFGLVTLKLTFPAGPPGKSDAAEEPSATAFTVTLWAVSARAEPVPDPVVDQVA